MTQQSKLEIKTLSVQIRVLTIDQKRFTKSVFDQLPWKSPIRVVSESPLKLELIAPILGYVRCICRSAPDYNVLLFEYEGMLYKCSDYTLVDSALVNPKFDLSDSLIIEPAKKFFQSLINGSPQLFISI